MYQNQFVLLTQQLQQQVKPSESLNQLLNNGDKRRKLLQQAASSGDRKLELLARRIATLEDLSPYCMRVDCVPEVKPKSQSFWGQTSMMTLFALINMGLITGAIIAYEDMKNGRIDGKHIFSKQTANKQPEKKQK